MGTFTQTLYSIVSFKKKDTSHWRLDTNKLEYCVSNNQYYYFLLFPSIQDRRQQYLGIVRNEDIVSVI